MTRMLKTCSALLLAFATISAQAANHAGSAFEIEMIVFERTRGMEQTSENWNVSPRLRYPSRWVDFNTAGEGAPFLAPAGKKLAFKAEALNRGGHYKVLFHQAWQQKLQLKRNSPAILISGGESFNGHRQLEGSITLSVAQYLHLSTNLWFSEFGGADAESGVLLPPAPQQPPAEEPGGTDMEPMGLSDAGLQPAIDAQPVADAQSPAPAVSTSLPTYAENVVLLREERRMRSGELHYIDHPAFGILIEVRKIAGEDE